VVKEVKRLRRVGEARRASASRVEKRDKFNNIS